MDRSSLSLISSVLPSDRGHVAASKYVRKLCFLKLAIVNEISSESMSTNSARNFRLVTFSLSISNDSKDIAAVAEEFPRELDLSIGISEILIIINVV